MCVFPHEMGLLNTAGDQWVLTVYPICQSVFFDWTFRPFTFKVNIVMCKFDPAILILAGSCLLVGAVFFIVWMVFTIWYIFAVVGTGYFFPRLVLPSGALVRQAWW